MRAIHEKEMADVAYQFTTKKDFHVRSGHANVEWATTLRLNEQQ